MNAFDPFNHEFLNEGMTRFMIIDVYLFVLEQLSNGIVIFWVPQQFGQKPSGTSFLVSSGGREKNRINDSIISYFF